MDRIEVIAVRFLFYHILPGNTDILPHAHTHIHAYQHINQNLHYREQRFERKFNRF